MKDINYKRKAWETFSKWVRDRDKRCITCGSTNRLCAGHFWHGVLDFDEENINCQCDQCNRYKSGNLATYSVYLLNKLGQEKFDALNIRHTRALGGEKRTPEEYGALIEKYKLL